MSAEGGPELGDAFGQILRDCQDAGQQPVMAFEVIERSNGLMSVGDASRYFAGVAVNLLGWPRGVLPLELVGETLRGGS